MTVLITLTDVEPAVRLNALLERRRRRDRDRVAARRRPRGDPAARSRTLVVMTGGLLDPHNVQLVRELLWDDVAVVGLRRRARPGDRRAPAALGYVEVFAKPVVARRGRWRRSSGSVERRELPRITGLIGESRGDSRGARQGRADRAGVEHGADRGRERHGQGAGRARASIASVPRRNKPFIA